MALRHEVVFMLFQRGKFDASATELTSQVLVYLLAGAYAFSAQTIVARGYYAVSNTLFPAVFGTLAVILSIPLYFLGMKAMGVKGVSLAISVSAFLQVGLIYAIWNRQSKNAESKSVYGFIFKLICLSAIIGFALELLKNQIYAYFNSTTFIGCMIVSVVVGLAFILMLLALGYFFRIEEIKIITNKVVAYFRSTGQANQARRDI
jgi:putative peptidoglycan lipid II flippase